MAGTPTVVAGACPGESIWQPAWSPDGALVFASDRSGWWNLERLRGGERTVLHAAEAEFGYPQWVFGDRSFEFLGDGRIACCYGARAGPRFAVLDPAPGELLDLDLPHDALAVGPGIVADGVGDRADRRRRATCRTRSCGSTSTPGPSRCCAESVSLPVDPSHLSRPRAFSSRPREV